MSEEPSRAKVHAISDAPSQPFPARRAFDFAVALSFSSAVAFVSFVSRRKAQ
jgi:hypothetical protein